MYTTIEPKTGQHSDRITDTWGYNYYGLYSVYLIDGTVAYREAVQHVMGNLDQMADYRWGGADAYADSIEGAINLYAREPRPQAEEYLDRQIPSMWGRQRADGIIEGWHGDGNSARTALMYAFWKTQGTYLEPWREDLRLGASRRDGKVYVVLAADEPWEGHIHFDIPRHREYLKLPMDYTRINQFPEWFTVESDASYCVRHVEKPGSQTRAGKELREGLPVTLAERSPTVLIAIERAP
jgi:hypothetical protein